jgi:hypothetical protein
MSSCSGGSPPICTPGTPSTETCNGLDDDCDGVVDESLGSTSCGLGACRVTVPSCSGGLPQTCTPGTPTAETCNGIDDDCDGIVDNSAVGCDLVVTDPVESAAIDCREGAPKPTIRWEPGAYDRYRVFASWTTSFSRSNTVTSGSSLLKSTSWVVPKKKRKKLCQHQVLYLRVYGVDRDVSKSHPLRKRMGPLRTIVTLK